jgi:hypothetical protein
VLIGTETIGHTGDVVTDYAIETLLFDTLRETIREGVGLSSVSSEKLEDHPAPPIIHLGHFLTTIDLFK